jgi:hypothetical protein
MMGPRRSFLFPTVQLINGRMISLQRIAHAKTRGRVPKRTP